MTDRPLRADARRNREAIIAAARSVFARDEKVRFDDFAARAGVGVGTLYRHFPTRESLAAAVYQQEVSSLCERARDPRADAGTSLEAFLRGFTDYLVENAALARTLAAVVDPAVQSGGGSELESTIADLMARAADEGTVRGDLPPGAVLVVLHGIGSTVGRPCWEAEARAATEVLIDGLRRRDP